MKKFTKGCLMTALVLFIVGMILCIVCGLLGGFRQLNTMDGIREISYWYGRNAIGGVEIDGKKEQLPLTSDTLGRIDIDVEACNILIQKSGDEHVWFLAESESYEHEPRYTIENDGAKSTLRIENEVKHPIDHWGNGSNDTLLYLWLPDGCALEECEIDMGAGLMESVLIKAKKMDISVGAGAIDVDGFEGEEILLSADAGEILAGRVTAETAVLEVDAGHLSIEELVAGRKADVNVSMGNCEIAGTITGDLDLECDMGETVLCLTGSEDDHSYDVECGMGEVIVGSYSHGGFATERSWNEGKDSQFDIDCSMGNVTVTFEE